MSYKIVSVEPTGVQPFAISATLRKQINYFMCAKSAEDERRLAWNEFEVDLIDAARWAERGAIRMASPLDSGHFAEVELTFEQLDLLDWLIAGQVKRLRVEESAE